jgi:hypothetical protein
MATRLAQATVGRFSPTVSMGVVEIGSADAATVQFLDAPHVTELRVGQPVHQGDVTVTLLESHPEPGDVRASYVVVESAPDPPVATGTDGSP